MPQKYEREIEEILVRMDDYRPRRREPFSRRLARTLVRWWRQLKLPGISVTPAVLMIASLVLVLLSYPVGWVLPQVAGPMATVSLVLLVIGLVMAFLMRGRRGGKPKWRGRDIDN
jgi:hypothetical protein